ncbi:uncharacterized protein LOC110710847 [Chenopodium quinoa]|uniref:uncharacterized protein LOC110710847 n=1 Tax=Chenopodium quinoa TaxID=63459 RepID=UPI000B773F18|nr:uncharacterized protein LOC110710847 [Chenopodium quinoa]
MKDIDTKRPRRLDLNAPLLSTRRSNFTPATVRDMRSSLELSRTGSLRGFSNRVPFSWEQSPGKPKYAITSDHNGVEEGNKVLPLPKPPPIRWQEDEPTLTNHKDGDKGDYGEGIADNVDKKKNNNDNNDDGGSFSDAIDLFSLAESLTTSERLDLESDFNGDNGSLSPNFMIQRFLPAATALAASSLSALAANKDKNNHPSSDKKYMGVLSNSNHFRDGSCVPRVAGEAYSSTKGCGFQIFFPWRAKHRLCGVKSPVRRVHANMKRQISPRKK